MFQSVAFLGLGLIGGSVAKALRRVMPDLHIAAYDPHTASGAKALTEGVINQILPSVDRSIADFDLIFLCMPVQYMEETLRLLKKHCKSTAIITDVGSTKLTVHKTVESLGMEKQFIGGHPMAGSERSGYDSADSQILQNAYYILTPCQSTPPAATEALKSLVEAIGSIPMIMEPMKHDYTVAGVSHLPHIIASALVNLVQKSDDEQQLMYALAAGGFKDITRIASSSPSLWEHICMDNRESVSALLEQYIDSLSVTLGHLREAEGDKLFDFFRSAGLYRSSLPDGATGALAKEHAIYCDIPDETGVIAAISTILAVHQISLKNIGIVHNRDFEEGVLRIVFYREQDCQEALQVLRNNRYIVHEKK